MKADALFWRSDFELSPQDDAYTQQSQCLVKPNQFQLFTTSMLHDDSLLEEIAKALPNDKFANAIKEGLTDSSKPTNKEDLNRFRFEGDSFTATISYMFRRAGVRLKFSKRVTMTHWLAIFGVTMTLELISQGYWWPQP